MDPKGRIRHKKLELDGKITIQQRQKSELDSDTRNRIRDKHWDQILDRDGRIRTRCWGSPAAPLIDCVGALQVGQGAPRVLPRDT